MLWPEERIRQELRLLDRKTGLNGSSLPIHFNNSTRTLGSFHSTRDDKPLYFTFSRTFCESDDYPEAQMLNTIRHEYAHYMVCVRYPNLNERSHGRYWQRCCMEVGANPQRACDTERNRELRRQEKAHEEESGAVRDLMTELHIGDTIVHPSFGQGIISGYTPNAGNPRISLTFQDGQKRIFPAKWIIENCI